MLAEYNALRSQILDNFKFQGNMHYLAGLAVFVVVGFSVKMLIDTNIIIKLPIAIIGSLISLFVIVLTFLIYSYTYRNSHFIGGYLAVFHEMEPYQPKHYGFHILSRIYFWLKSTKASDSDKINNVNRNLLEIKLRDSFVKRAPSDQHFMRNDTVAYFGLCILTIIPILFLVISETKYSILIYFSVSITIFTVMFIYSKNHEFEGDYYDRFIEWLVVKENTEYFKEQFLNSFRKEISIDINSNKNEQYVDVDKGEGDK